jgi:hypothetical protein
MFEEAAPPCPFPTSKKKKKSGESKVLMGSLKRVSILIVEAPARQPEAPCWDIMRRINRQVHSAAHDSDGENDKKKEKETNCVSKSHIRSLSTRDLPIRRDVALSSRITHTICGHAVH